MTRVTTRSVVSAALTAATAWVAMGAELQPRDGTPVAGTKQSTRADWLKDARIGAFMHFLPNNPGSFANVKDFDVE